MILPRDSLKNFNVVMSTKGPKGTLGLRLVCGLCNRTMEVSIRASKCHKVECKCGAVVLLVPAVDGNKGVTDLYSLTIKEHESIKYKIRKENSGLSIIEYMKKINGYTDKII